MALLKNILITLAVSPVALGLSMSATPRPLVETIAQLEPGSFMESMIIRPNGDILATNLGTNPGIYTLRNPSSKGPRALELLTTVPAVQTLWGITQLPCQGRDETYVFVGGNLDLGVNTFNPIAGTWKAFKLTISSKNAVHTEVISDFSPNTQVLNGLGPVPGSPGTVLIGESSAGSIARLNTNTGAVAENAFRYPETEVRNDTVLPLGVGSVKIRGNYLYFSSFPSNVYRLPVNRTGFALPGAKPELVVDFTSVSPGIDDFVFDKHGNIYATTNVPSNSVAYFNVKSGEKKVVLGGPEDPTIIGSASLAFGRGPHDKHILYICTGRVLTDNAGRAKLVALNTQLL